MQEAEGLEHCVVALRSFFLPPTLEKGAQL